MELIIFDLDGTLVNSLEDLARATNFALEKNGFPVHDTEKYRYFIGNGIPKLIERALPEDSRTDEKKARVKADFDSYYHVHYADKTRPYSGIDKLLRELKAEGFRLAVASNKADEFTRVIVNTYFKDVFDAVSGSREGLERKPAPGIIYSLMEQTGADKENTIIAGDSSVDILTAKNAGVKSVGCLWGFRTREELENAGADAIVSAPEQIPAAVRELIDNG